MTLDNTIDQSLEGLQPQKLWEIFDEIRKIPRKSGQEKAALDFLVGFAVEHGFEYRHDLKGNLCIFIPSSPGYETAASICFQGHADMVCVKDDDSDHDFDRDPIQLRREGDLLKAKGTTLGADNGIGLAASLALAIDPEVTHPALEILVTIEEENGLKGVDALNTSQLGMRSTKVFNLDMQNLGEVFVTSAGLAPVNARRSIEREVVPENSGKYIQINVRGMKGGHSGIYIHENRGNAIMVLNDLLKSFDHGIRLVSMEGGQAMNAIAGAAQAIVYLPASEDFAIFQNKIDEYRRTLDPEWGAGFSLAEVSQDEVKRKVIVLNIHQQIVRAISQFPQGIRKMSDLVPGMVQTSGNIGVIRTDEDDIHIEASVRSDLDEEMDGVFEEIRKVLGGVGFDVHMPVRSPGWRQDPESPLIQAVSKAYDEVTGKTPEIKGIHAALETGVVVSKLSNTLGGQSVEGVSFGPTIQDAHSPHEAVNVPSVRIFYEQLKEAMKILVQQMKF